MDNPLSTSLIVSGYRLSSPYAKLSRSNIGNKYKICRESSTYLGIVQMKSLLLLLVLDIIHEYY